MANKPVMGVATCPKCGKDNPLVWNGNYIFRCIHCCFRFRVKRQKLKKVKRC